MIRIIFLAIVALNVLVSCASHTDVNQTYQPITRPEKTEFARDRLDVYPDDVRAHPELYTNTAVAWTGIIRSTTTRDDDQDNKVMADTFFEHHYFDWVQDNQGRRVKLSISPRGEGMFRARWYMDKVGPAADEDSAQKYAAAGNLAIVYGVPIKVDPDGTVVLRYRYLRILGPEHFTMKEFDYGRLGDFHVIPPEGGTNLPAR